MVHTTRDGKVSAEVGEVDLDLGTVERGEQENIPWEASCALDDEKFVGTTKSAAVDLLEDHFIQAHTTP